MVRNLYTRGGGLEPSCMQNRTALIHPKDKEIFLQLPAIGKIKECWESRGSSPDFSSMFSSARAPGFDDCRDDGSPDEFPHLHFQ